MPIAASLAKAAFTHLQGGSGKPHSSISEWIDILTSDNYQEEELDGIPEIVESINLQAEGPTEASRAIRKKLKHGTTHQKYRALVILKTLVENGDKKFQTTFSDDRLISAIRDLASDPTTDVRVKKKLVAVLASWQRQFKDDPSMKTIAGLYDTCRQDRKVDLNVMQGILLIDQKQIDREKEATRKKRQEEDDARRKIKEKEDTKRRDKEEAKRKEKERRDRANRPKRPPFNFETEKPQIITSIATAGQASTNLVNAITLVHTKESSVESNARVQECLTTLKAARKAIVRYIQLVENEELIGTLLDTNERIIAALAAYDVALQPQTEEPESVAEGKQPAPPVDGPRGELNKLQHRQRVEIHRAASSNQLDSPYSPNSDLTDLRGIDFGNRGLQAPMQPRTGRRSSSDEDGGYDNGPARGTLSDYSDYEDSDGGRPPRSDSSGERYGASSSAAGSKRPITDKRAAYGNLLGDEDDLYSEPKRGLLSQEDDPFADPFADTHARR